jgi:undecaprenyl-diphosphatase
MLLLCFITIFCIVGISLFDYFPGDIVVTQYFQKFFPSNTLWADTISNIAKFPYSIILLIITVIISFFINGLRAVVLSIISFVGLSMLDKFIKIFVFQTRPSVDLISVSTISTSSSFPSTSGIVYIATFGFLLMLSAKFWRNSLFNKLVFFSSFIPLVVIFIARIVLGAHWPSDIIVTYMLGIVFVMLLLPFLSKNQSNV